MYNFIVRRLSKLLVNTFIVASLLPTNMQSASAAASLISDLEITSKMVAVEKGSPAAGKTPFTLTIQTKIKNNNSSSVMTYNSLESAVWLTGGVGGAFVTPASAGTVSASVTPTSGSVIGTDVLSPTSTTSRSFVFPNAQVTSIPANSYVQIQFDVTVTFTTGSAGTVNLLGTVNSGESGYVGGLQSNQDSDLSSLSGLTIVVSTGGGVTASFGTAGLLGYACGDNNSGFTTTCFVNNTYYGKPYVMFTATAPEDGYRFDGWGDDCSTAGTSSTCTLRVTGNPIISANYSLLPFPTPTSVSTSPEYFEDNTTINGTVMDSADGWAIHYVGSAGTADDLIFKSTSFISQGVTSVTVQLPTIAQIETYSATFFGSARSASSGLTWIIYPYADFTSYTTYGGTAPNLVINSATIPDSPDIGSASTVSSVSATVSFTAPSNQGGRTITSYTVSVWNDALDTVLKTQSYSSSLPTLGASATFTVTGLTPSTIYKFSIVATNSLGNSYQSFATAAITTSATSSGGGTTTSTTAADELRRQQDTTAAAKQKQDQELTEILAIIPKIAELTLSLGETTKSLYSTKCVKGKTTKYVKKGAKCPKRYVKK